MKISELIEWFEDNGMEDDLEIYLNDYNTGYKTPLTYDDIQLIEDNDVDNGMSQIWIG